MTISALIKLRDKSEVELENSGEDSFLKSLIVLFFGGLFLYYGSEWFIDGAIMLANSFGISERIIGITVVSVGTSIPELVTSLVAVLNKEKSISLGNLLGSNIFNVFAVLGITSLVAPLKVLDQSIINYDIYVMLFFAALVLPLIFFPKKLQLARFFHSNSRKLFPARRTTERQNTTFTTPVSTPSTPRRFRPPFDARIAE